MIVSDALRAVAFGSIAVAYAAGVLVLVQIAVVAFAESTLFVLFTLAERTAPPHAVAHGQMPAALARNEARTSGATLAKLERCGLDYLSTSSPGTRALLAG